MSYALAASYSFILLITLTPSKALNITVLSTHLKSASSFSSRHAVPCVSITKPSPMQRIETVLISILSLLNDAEVSSPANADAGVMLRNKSDEYKSLVNKDLELSKQEIPAGR
ncbi:hypothetical protein HBI88_106400 [Parastagonospora nodorum]|nr:hypothetical protein HBI97_089850 [Parastagonospora nodorum]KAH5821548.1 hypothetical protein HBI94_096720 [Parastagonospora nodorum]KAH5833973.1 hypothetical protein HBI93_105010 [Parastagonospora nodorum]KAH5847085.1 hypothetical protein HBI90_238500 [Parastagonospora nodorum]KAH5865834.1 hypothetical protein HBI91_101950 [Parastagonospora nodorum]